MKSQPVASANHPVPSRLRRYGAAALSSALAVLLSLAIENRVTEANTFMPFIAAVAFNSWYSGAAMGVWTALIGVLVGAFLLWTPVTLLSPHPALHLVEFMTVSFLVILFNAARQRAQQRAEQASAEAEAANRDKDLFLATVSHELRAPLNSILGWSKLLQSNRLDAPTARRALDTIERSARLQNQLIEDLLDLTRIATGKLDLERRAIELTPVIEAAVDAIRPIVYSKQLQFEVAIDPSPSAIFGDPTRLQQIVWNLLSNAVKFTPSGGTIKLELRITDSNALIKVSDTGQGITPEFIPHVFESFSQADTARGRRDRGLGLGLAIVRHIVELHGGMAKVESQGVGKGSVFTVILPLLTITSPRTRYEPPKSDLNTHAAVI